MKKRERNGCKFLKVPLAMGLIFLTMGIFAQMIGDYRSSQSGDWDDPDSWELFGGTVWIPATSFPDDPDADVTIRDGHEIIFNESNAETGTLMVETGGKLYTNSSGIYRYMLVFGNVLCDGIIGNLNTTDGICLKPEGDTCHIYGNGDCRFRRIRKDESVNDTTTLIIGMPVEIYYDGTSDALYNNQSGTLLNIELSEEGSLLLHASLDLDGCTFTVHSDSTGTGSVVAPNVQNDDSTNVTIEQFIQKDNSWHFLSSPVEDQPLEPCFVPVPIDNSFDFYKWHEASPVEQAWINVRDSTGSFSSVFEDAFVVGRGYLTAFSDTNGGHPVRAFSGTINDGNKQLTVENTLNGWNLKGNPYPCSLDWSSAGIDKTDLTGSAMYIWDQELNAGLGGYRTHNGSIGVPASTVPFIPPMNGFFVHAINSGSITIDPDIDSPLVNSITPFYKGKENIQAIRIAITGENNMEECVIVYDPSSSNGPEGLDALKLFLYHPDIVEVFSEIDTVSSIINCFGEYPYSAAIGTYTESVETIAFTFMGQELYDPTVNIWFEDIRENVTFSVRETSEYIFQPDPGLQTGRFFLHFEEEFTHAEVLNHTFGATINGLPGGIIRITDPGSKFDLIEVYDITGRVLIRENLLSSGSSEIFIMQHQGIALVKLSGTSGSYVQKINLTY